MGEVINQKLDALNAIHPFPWRYEKLPNCGSQVVSVPVADADDNRHGIVEVDSHEGWFDGESWELIVPILNALWEARHDKT